MWGAATGPPAASKPVHPRARGYRRGCAQGRRVLDRRHVVSDARSAAAGQLFITLEPRVE